MSAHRISVPPGSDVRLAYFRPICWVSIVPPGAKIPSANRIQPGEVLMLIKLDPGIKWPDRAGCATASTLLANGSAVAIEIARFGDALAARDRLIREMQQ